MRATLPFRTSIFIACFGLLGSVQGQQAGAPATTQPDASRPRAYLRFDAPLYKAGDCARVSLMMLDASADARGAPPTVEVAVGDRTRATGRAVVPMRPAGEGRYESEGCVRLVGNRAGARARSLRVVPGSVLGALARDAKGHSLAAALAVVPAKSSGKIGFAVAPAASGAAQAGTAQADEFMDEQGRSIRFVRDHVIVLERDRAELARFLARRHGEIVASLGRHHLVKVDSRTASSHGKRSGAPIGGSPVFASRWMLNQKYSPCMNSGP